jgi:hypothetical protein
MPGREHVISLLFYGVRGQLGLGPGLGIARKSGEFLSGSARKCQKVQ